MAQALQPSMQTTLNMEYVVRNSVRIKAHPQLVWEALTNPEITKEYFFNARVISDFKKNSPIRFEGKMFLVIPFKMSGTIIDIVPGKMLKYKLENKDGSGSTVTDSLEYDNGFTTLFIADDVGQEEGAQKRYNRSVKGWAKILSGLKKTVEEKLEGFK